MLQLAVIKKPIEMNSLHKLDECAEVRLQDLLDVLRGARGQQVLERVQLAGVPVAVG